MSLKACSSAGGEALFPVCHVDVVMMFNSRFSFQSKLAIVNMG